MEPEVRALIERVVAARVDDLDATAFNDGYEARLAIEKEERLAKTLQQTPPPQPHLSS